MNKFKDSYKKLIDALNISQSGKHDYQSTKTDFAFDIVGSYKNTLIDITALGWDESGQNESIQNVRLTLKEFLFIFETLLEEHHKENAKVEGATWQE